MNIRVFAACCMALALAGCATERGIVPAPLDLPPKTQEPNSRQTGPAGTSETLVTETPKVPALEASSERGRQPGAPAPGTGAEVANVTLNFEQIPLPSFVQVVYGSTLKRNVNVDPAVMARTDLITIRTGAPQTPTQVADAARLLLKSYGIAVVDLGSIVRVVPDTGNLGYLPEIRRGRALPDTPLSLRPIFQLVELQAVRNTDIAQWLRTMFGTKVTLQEDPSRNAVWLSGQPDDVAAAMEAVRILDQPLMKGRNSVRVSPVYMSADELARKLAELLLAEGYAAGPPTAGVAMPVSLVPIPAVNAVFVFASDPRVLTHVVDWAKELDQPQTKGIGRTYFSYQVRYSDAQGLANTLEKVLGSGRLPAAATPGAPPSAAPAPLSSRVVVDQSTNTIIFQGSAEDYGQIRNILEMLDRQTKQALIEVTVAELAINDNSQLGVEWLINKASLGDIAVRYGTLGGLGIGSSGFNYSRIDTANGRTLLLNALASDNRATILSSPRIVARNGETATIQVGQEVPIITSQQTNPTTGGTGGVLQTVQYKNAGVILKVRPVIHSGNQVDLEVNQEVSAAASTTTGVSTSPTFSTRRVETKLSLREGATVLLGGLISSNTSQGNAGIPILKNIPLLGQLFRVDTGKQDRTELIILITPYIIANDNDAQAVTDAFRQQLGDWARTQAPGASRAVPLPGIAPNVR
jgi:general secretion pathway protein D